jgi:hypothetical protein
MEVFYLRFLLDSLRFVQKKPTPTHRTVLRASSGGATSSADEHRPSPLTSSRSAHDDEGDEAIQNGPTRLVKVPTSGPLADILAKGLLRPQSATCAKALEGILGRRRA